MERSTEDPDTLIITYEGLHLHFAYSHFLLTRPSLNENTHSPPKKPKTHTQVAQDDPHQVGPTSVAPLKMVNKHQPFGAVIETPHNPQTQGLLEDVVPLLIRNPSNNPTSSSDPCFSSYPSSPPLSTSSSSLSWSPNSSPLDMGMLSGLGWDGKKCQDRWGSFYFVAFSWFLGSTRNQVRLNFNERLSVFWWICM